jgi:O-antigen/teichoic acid export membrane protein
MTLADRIARGVKASLIARVVHIASNSALLVVLTRYLLEPGEYGQLYFALSVLGIAILFSALGVPKATARYVTEYAETDESQIPYLIERTLLVLLVLCGVVALVMAAGRGLISDLLGEPGMEPFLLVGAGHVAAKSLQQYVKTVFQGFNRVSYSAIVSSVNGVARFVLAVLFVVMGYGALGALAGYVAAFALSSLLGLGILYAKFYRRYERGAEPEDGLLRRVLEYSVPTAATRAGVVLDSRVDSLLLGVLSGTVAVGFYTVARQIADVCIVPAQSVGYTITPALGEQKAADQAARGARLYERSLENVLLLYVPAGVGLILVAEPAIRYVFTADYLGAVPVVQLFSLFILVRAVHKITGSGLDYLGLARVRAVARTTTALGNVGLNVLLIPRYGAVGAGIATVTTYTLYTIVNVYYIHREFSLRLGFLAKRIAQILAISLVMGGGVVLALPYVDGLPTLIATILLGGAVWAILVLLSGLVDPREVRAFLS